MANGDQTQQPLNYQQQSDIQFLLNMIDGSEQPVEVEEVSTDQPIEIPNLSYQNFKKLFEKADDSMFLGYEGAVSDKLRELYPELVTVPFAPGRDIVAVKNPETQEVREFNLDEIDLKTQEGLDELKNKYEEIAAFVGSTSEEFKNTAEGKIYELTGIHNEEDYGELKEDTKGAFDAIVSERGTDPTITGGKLNADQQLDLSYNIINKFKNIINDPTGVLPNYNMQEGIKEFPFSSDEVNEIHNHVYEEITKEDEFKHLTKESFNKILKKEQLFRKTQAEVKKEIDKKSNQENINKYRNKETK